MKYFLFLLSFLCCTFIFAQNKSFYKQTYFSSRIEKVLPLPNGQMAYLGVVDDVTSYNKMHRGPFVGILDSNFKEIKHFYISHPSFMVELRSWRVFELIGKDSLLIGIETKSCDVNNTKAAAVILDTKTGKFSDFEPDFMKTAVGMSSMKDGTIMILGKKEGGFYTVKNFDLVGFINLNGSPIESYTYFGGNKKFYYFLGNELNSATSSWTNPKMIFQLPDSLKKDFNAVANFLEIKEDEKFAFWNGKKLRLIDTKGKIIKSFSLSENYLGVYFSAAKNLIFATSKSNMMTFDTAFNLLKMEKIEGDRDFLARGFFETKNGLYLCGRTVHLPQKVKFNFTLYEGSLTSIPTIRPFVYDKPKNDVMVENIVYQNNPPIIVKSYDVSANKTSFVHNINFGDIGVKITNTGSDTIKSITINTQHECYYVICPWDISNLWNFDKLKIAPGESTIVTLPNVTVGSIPKIANDKFCFWVSNVNNKPDANPDNDYSCAPFAITVATNDIVENDGYTKVFPNPTSDELTVSSDKKPIQNVEIFDVAGRKVFSQNVDDQMNVSFSIASFQKGMYLVLVKNAEGRTVHKIVKED